MPGPIMPGPIIPGYQDTYFWGDQHTNVAKVLLPKQMTMAIKLSLKNQEAAWGYTIPLFKVISVK